MLPAQVSFEEVLHLTHAHVLSDPVIKVLACLMMFGLNTELLQKLLSIFSSLAGVIGQSATPIQLIGQLATPILLIQLATPILISEPR